MIDRLKTFWKRSEPTVQVGAATDHIELAETYLMLGLNIGWENSTSQPVNVQEVHLRLYVNGRKQEPTRFYYQGTFARRPGQKVISKAIGAQSFKIAAGESHIQGMRFYTRAILNLEEGTYPAEVHTTVAEGTFINEIKVPIANSIKYRTSEAWTTEVTLVPG